MRHTTRYTDWAFLLIAVISIALVVLAILFFWRPVAGGGFEPRWWQAVSVGVLFFAAVGLGYRRKLARSRMALRQALDETRAGLAAEANAEGTRARPPAEREVRRPRRRRTRRRTGRGGGSGDTKPTVAE